MRHEAGAPFAAHDVEMINMAVLPAHRRQRQRQAGQRLVIAGSDRGAARISASRYANLAPRIAACKVSSREFTPVSWVLRILSQPYWRSRRTRARQLGIVRDHHAAIANGPEILGRIETEAGDITKTTDRLPRSGHPRPGRSPRGRKPAGGRS